MIIDCYNFLRRYVNYVNKKLIPSKKRMKRPRYLEKFNVLKKALYNANDFFKTKYNIRRDIYFDRDVLPNLYYKDEIVLLPKNTNTLFAYWEVKEETFNNLKKEHNVYNEGVLRVYKEDKLFRTLKIQNRIGSTYIHKVRSDNIYEISLGFINEKGEFFEVAKSNNAIAPRDKVSNNKSITWGRGIRANNKIYLKRYEKSYLPDEDTFISEKLDKEIKAFKMKFVSSNLLKK